MNSYFLDCSPEAELLPLPQQTSDTEAMQVNPAEVRQEIVSITNLHSLAQVRAFLQLLLSRAEWRVLVLPLLYVLALSSQGCSIMYQPRFDEESGFREPPSPLSDEEIARRTNLIRELLVEPQDKSNLALLSGISDEKKQRIVEHMEGLFSETHPHDFTEYLNTCRLARDKLGIFHFDRYPPQVLREVVSNHKDVERHRDRQAVIVFMARKDKNRFGIDALNVEAHLIERLLTKYKVYLFETGSMTEMLFHLQYLIKGTFLSPGKLKGLVLGAHGNEHENETGIDADTLHSLGVLDDYFQENALVVAANCYAAEGGNAADNLVSRFTLLWSRRKNIRVFGCDELLIDVDFEMDEDGTFIEDSLRLRSPLDWLTLGMIGSTHEGNADEIIASRINALGEINGVSQDFIRAAVEHGIFDEKVIRKLSETDTTPEAYHEMNRQLALFGISLSPLVVIDCLHRQLTALDVFMYVGSNGGVRKSLSIKDANDIAIYTVQRLQAQDAEQVRIQLSLNQPVRRDH